MRPPLVPRVAAWIRGNPLSWVRSIFLFVLGDNIIVHCVQLRDHGYVNIDGLDPSSGLLAAAQEKGLYQETICAYVTPDVPTPVRLFRLSVIKTKGIVFLFQVKGNTYDVLLCSAGMFPGSIIPQVHWNLG